MTKKTRLSKSDKLVTVTEQTYAHLDSRVISSKRDVLIKELDSVNESITRDQKSLDDSKTQRTSLEAQIAGMTNVLAKR